MIAECMDKLLEFPVRNDRPALEMTRQCAWCGRILQDGEWLQIVPTGLITHGICPECSAQIHEELWRSRRRTNLTFSSLAG